ncbi:RNA polymerase Rpc34 subunit-domain-containing protein [Dunaliella salina]|uniref:RNA polymerase Rpc34 subunit-domain-containing protein n=1 Tax=Dunaliella salina TaxID=3046 RepID=A0ABQ7GYN1_DUNSA|nr:RNA polymerase Rpc34 subunit-domain-containing protein [Dunaliella salina]|eukprot:KAF5839723.1 RNA polymerase Rpc34 subunit-domain-containing protein [Dunaliella salina]
MSAPKAALDAIVEVLRKHKKGVSDDVLQKELPQMTPQDRAKAINDLLGSKRLQLFHVGTGSKRTMHYKEITAEEAAKYKGLGPEETLLYQQIKSVGNTVDAGGRGRLLLGGKGWRGVRGSSPSDHTPLPHPRILDITQPCKAAHPQKYTENQFDAAFIDALRDACMQFIQRKGNTTLREIGEFIASKKFAKVDLRDEDIHSIIQTLVYDGRVDTVADEFDEEDHFTPIMHPVPPATAFTSIPCGVCPVFSECRDDGVVSPATCEYFDKWLEF